MIEIQAKIERPAFQLEIDLNLSLGELYVITGPSGSGKTTFFNLFNGSLKPHAGLIKVSGQLWFSAHNALTVRERGVAMVYADFALFPNMNVFENLAFARHNKLDDSEYQRIIESCDIHTILDRKISSLSTGQKQRVAIARSLMQKSSLILMDEPFSAQDREHALALFNFILNMQIERGCTVLLATHHPEIIKMRKEGVLTIKDNKLFNKVLS